MSDPRIPLPLLITGIAGVAGYNAFHYFRARYPGQVVGIRPVERRRMVEPGMVACNVEDGDGLKRLFDQHQFQSVLDCAGNCALKDCELDPPMAWRLNVEGPRRLLAAMKGGGARLVHLSVDLVFSGASGLGGYVEENPPDPVTVYGKTMVEGERLVQAEEPRSCIARISLPMGISLNGHAGAIDWIQHRFVNSRPATLYFDEVRTPAYTDCLNPLFETLLGNQLSGLYHAGGPRRLSLYQIAQIVNRIGGYDPRLLQGIYRRHAGPVPPRAGNVAMNSRKLADALGANPLDSWPYSDDLVPAHREWHFERPPGTPDSFEYLARVLYRNPARPVSTVPGLESLLLEKSAAAGAPA